MKSILFSSFLKINSLSFQKKSFVSFNTLFSPSSPSSYFCLENKLKFQIAGFDRLVTLSCSVSLHSEKWKVCRATEIKIMFQMCFPPHSRPTDLSD
jgi:hypothetical protein